MSENWNDVTLHGYPPLGKQLRCLRCGSKTPSIRGWEGMTALGMVRCKASFHDIPPTPTHTGREES